MAFSTRQLADLAGTTVKAVRHYHEIGLLDMPERASNGYKQYRMSHLMRLIQIKRLSDLGVPLSQVAAMGRADEEPDEAIRVLDAELAATVDRLNRVRAELAVILRHRAPMHVSPDLAPLSRNLSDSQRSLLTVYSKILSKEALPEFLEMISESHSTDDDFETFPDDADEAAIDQLAERMLPEVRAQIAKYPWTKNPAATSPLGPEFAANAMGHAVAEFYRPVQIQVLIRLDALLSQQESDDDTI
ncbi:helix-turn-helix domain-containing protein [Nocardia callitridis]|uniref:MerR family transcriptional regulator n=1 Tax=Nocardia callitridis TaxID=648753 RepID=A0ABP9KE14_9NOCA